jgi:RNA polymerase sigma-70 factor (ECF subfamily)
VDSLAFAAVFDRHWPKLFRYCVFRAGTSGEDIVAETFRVAFDQRDRYDGRADAGPWLFGIATNLLRELFRRTARADRALHRAVADVELDSVDGVIDRLDAQLARPELAAVLARMSPVERDALLLHACAELSFEEIARATSVPIGTVSSRIRRAKVQMRAHFDSLEVCR